MNTKMIEGFIIIIMAVILFASFSVYRTFRYDCMAANFTGLYVEVCGPEVKCTTSEYESGSLKTCRYEEKGK